MAISGASRLSRIRVLHLSECEAGSLILLKTRCDTYQLRLSNPQTGEAMVESCPLRRGLTGKRVTILGSKMHRGKTQRGELTPDTDVELGVESHGLTSTVLIRRVQKIAIDDVIVG